MALKGVDANAKIKEVVLDYTHDLVEPDLKSWERPRIKDGVLTLWKPDFFSAAFLLTFDE